MLRRTRIYQNIHLSTQTRIELSSDAFKHLMTVLRFKLGDEFFIFNGEGGEYLATIESIHKKTAHARIGQFIAHCVESPVLIHLLQTIAKGDKMDWIIQKSVELGVTEITPLFSDFSNVHLSTTERLNKKRDHWYKIAIQSAEQCGRTKIPWVHTPKNFSDLFCPEIFNTNIDLCFILHPDAKLSLKDALLKFDGVAKPSKPISMAVVIGPEGGLNDKEIRQAMQYELIPIIPVGLGPRILRTETAPIAILSILQFCLGDFHGS